MVKIHVKHCQQLQLLLLLLLQLLRHCKQATPSLEC
jgi:hypothetical protein